MSNLEERIVSLETALLAESKGFKDIIGVIKGKSYYNHNGDLNGDVIEQLKDKSLKSIAAPKQNLLQKWLREEHSIILTISFGVLCKKYCYEICFKGKYNIIDSEFIYKTYEEALEQGLKEGLNLIK